MKRIPGYECKYSATKDGKIWSEYKQGFLSPKIDKKGYEVVVLYKKGHPKTFLVHRLIALTFIENPNELPTVNHKDGNPLNNRLDNLEWMSFSDNLSHAYKTGLRCNKGINGKFSENDIRDIRELLNDGMKRKEISELYGVAPSTIYHIETGRTWSHVI